MQPGNPGQDPYGQQPNQDPNAPQPPRTASRPAGPVRPAADLAASRTVSSRPRDSRTARQDPYGQQQPQYGGGGPTYPNAGYPQGARGRTTPSAWWR